jgi:hypothetical protein
MLATKPYINNEFIDAIKLLRNADKRVTCEAKNVCDKADMNLGKGNITIWYHCVVCGRERAMVSMGFTRNSYGWVPAATQLPVTLAPMTLHGEVSPWDYLWHDSYGFRRKIHLPEVGNHVLWGRVSSLSSMMWHSVTWCVLELWINVILGLLWNGHLTNGDECKVTEVYFFEIICMFSLQDMPVGKRLLHLAIIAPVAFLRNDLCLHYDIYTIAMWAVIAQSV